MEYNRNSLFFEHRYPTLNIEHAIEHMESFEQFERYYTDDLMDENLLLGRYLYGLLEKYKMSANKASILIGKTHSYVRKSQTERSSTLPAMFFWLYVYCLERMWRKLRLF